MLDALSSPVYAPPHRRRADQQAQLDPCTCTKQPNHQQCPMKAGSPNMVCVETYLEIEYCGFDCMDCLEMEGAENVASVKGTCQASSCARTVLPSAEMSARRLGEGGQHGRNELQQ